MKPEYIFISGVSRSGTTLLLKMLDKSSDIALCRENAYLGHQLPWEGMRYIIRRKIGDLSDDANVYRLADFLYDGGFRRSGLGHWGWLRRKTNKEAFLEKVLSASDRSDRAIFVMIMEMRGDYVRQNNPNTPDDLILGEKTPSHIYYVPTLLEWFPNSKVIHMFRDPRAIFASESRRRKKSPLRFPYRHLTRTGPFFTFYLLLQVTYAWLRASNLHFRYEKLYPDRYYLQRFEDLVAEPESSTRKLCEFLEVDFQEVMLEQKVVSRGVGHGRAGFDGRAADRWKDVNPPWINSWFLFWGKQRLKALGYAA